MSDSLYQLLEIGEDASPLAIKSAYRRLAKRFHPDSGAPADVERFRRIRDAYEVLSDPERRRAYDHSRRTPSSPIGGAHPVSWTGGFVEPLVPDRGIGARPPGVPFGEPQLDLVMTPEEASRGARLMLEVPRIEPCPSCGRSGRDFFGWCRHCGGDGWLRSIERVTLTVPPGARAGDRVLAQLANGVALTARVRIRY